jgi:phage replication O-like protein O
MADVQLENGYTRIANQILEKMAQIKLNATQYRIVMVVWRYTYGFDRTMHELSISFISQATGCSERQIQRELKDLCARRILVQQSQKGRTNLLGFNKNYDEWGEEKIVKRSATPVQMDGGKRPNGHDQMDTPDQLPPDPLDRGHMTNQSGEPPSNETGKKENITKKLKEINDDDDESVRDEMTPQELFRTIETKYIQRRARGTQTTPQDDADIRQVIEYGIPLDDVLRFIDERFDTYEPKHPRDRINSFGYVADYIFQRYHEEQQKKNVKRSEFTVIEGGAQYGSTTRKSMGSGMGESKPAQEYSGNPSGIGDASITKGRTGRLRRPTYV